MSAVVGRFIVVVWHLFQSNSGAGILSIVNAIGDEPAFVVEQTRATSGKSRKRSEQLIVMEYNVKECQVMSIKESRSIKGDLGRSIKVSNTVKSCLIVK